MSSAVRFKSALRSPLLPIWLVIFLLPFGRSSELGTLLCLLGAILLFAREPHALSEHAGARLLLWLWAAYTGAALVSSIDATEMGRSWLSVAGFIRYIPLGLYVCFAVRRRSRLHALLVATAVVVALWALDAWVQMLTGWSLGGHAPAVRITGIFGADDMKLGPVLASLSPLVLWVARERCGRIGLVAAFVFLLGPILLAGERSAWLVYALVGLAFAWRESGSAARFALWCAGACVAAAIATGLAWQFSPRFQDRAERTAQLFHGTEAGINTALSGRLDIWRTAWGMYLGHPVNGVGVRDFRYAYPDFAPRKDHFLVAESCGKNQGACHPHQLLLEIVTNTGTLGLLIWLAGGWLAWRRWREVGPAARDVAFPVSVMLAVTLFPINTHLAFYSAWWGLLFWWMLSLWCAALYVREDSGEAA
ncbi:MAG TPA: O-antigen ligase family protein [Oleiagrimonas sp.]|nr:O-antigen ligase family protein [Oleiagrimonas sp.]